MRAIRKGDDSDIAAREDLELVPGALLCQKPRKQKSNANCCVHH